VAIEAFMMKASVIVCTRNRANLLRRVLESILAADWPYDDGLEVLAVDNGSTDETPAAVRELAGKDPRVRHIREDRQGKSHALNRGIAESRSDLLIFTDDDTRVDRRWLTALCSAAENLPADAYGGRIIAEWDVPVPDWVPRLSDGHPYGGAIVEHDRGDEVMPYTVDSPSLPFGSNILFRRRVFEKVGGYHADLGISGKSQYRGQDKDMARRVLQAGMAVLYVPDAIVYHPVFPDRLTKPFFRQWFYSHGRGDIAASDRWKGEPRMLGFPRRYVSGAARALLRLGVRSLVGKPHEVFAEQCCFLTHYGHLVEVYHQRRKR